MSTLTQPFATTPPYWALAITFALLAYLVAIEGSVVVGVWLAFLFAVIIIPAGFLEVY